ncbi:hypothetical protein [Agromyces sp. SYSU T00194]|uniref:hypothetical protein n=1 Tax=Agromyces chitinivorans TaxID=3158560 RepID=UPI003395F7C6
MTAEGTSSTATDAAPTTLQRIWSVVGNVIAPATLIGAVLFYFGYVSSRAQFRYFGVDVDVLGFSTQEFIMRSPQPLLVPMLALLLLSALLAAVHVLLRRRFGGRDDPRVRAGIRALRITGIAFLVAAVLLLAAFPLIGAWPYYPLATPIVLGVGAGLLAYAVAWGSRHPTTAPPTHASATDAPGPAPTAPRPRGRAVVVLLGAVVVVTVFWATATLAEWSGRGQAKALARDLGGLPAIVLDLGEPLVPGDPVVREEALPAGDGDAFRFRYRGLRLLVVGEDRLFLVPAEWTPSGSTYVVPFDDSARVRFRFVNDPP